MDNNSTQKLSYTPNEPENKQNPTLSICKRDYIFGVMLLVFSLISANALIYGGYNLGFSVGAVGIMTVSAIYCFDKSVKGKAYPVFSLICGILIALSFFLYSDASTSFFASVLMLCLSAIGFLGLSGQNTYPLNDDKSVIDILKFWFVFPFNKLQTTTGSFLASKKEKYSGIGKVLVGIVAAIPLILIVIPLLISSDAAFEGLMSGIFSGRSLVHLVVTLLFGIGFFILFFSAVFSLNKKQAKDNTKYIHNGYFAAGGVIAFLSVLSLCYILYLFSQLAYFFDAFSGILPKDFTFSEYARRGFFEMCYICFINLGVLLLARLITRKTSEGDMPLGIKIISVFISVFSIVLISTALAKMIMYIDSYGLTRKRVITSVFMVALLVVFVIFIIKTFVAKLPSLKLTLISLSVICVIFCFTNIDGMIAKHNTERYLQGEISLDIESFHSLSDASVPSLIEIAESNSDLSFKAKQELYSRANGYFNIKDWKFIKRDFSISDIRGFNITDSNAEKLLWENKDLFEFLIKADY